MWKKKKYKKVKLDVNDLEYILWAIDFTKDHVSVSNMDYQELITLYGYLEDMKNDIEK